MRKDEQVIEEKENKKETKLKSPYKIDEKEKLDLSFKGLFSSAKPKNKLSFKNILETIKIKLGQFLKLETSLKICIAVPIIIIVILLTRVVKNNTTTTQLKCSYDNYSQTIRITQEVNYEFKETKLYSETITTTYEVIDSKTKTLGTLESEKKNTNEEINKIKGVKASYKIEDDKLINTVKYNYYKIDEAELKELGKDAKATLENLKKIYEDTYGYECESK